MLVLYSDQVGIWSKSRKNSNKLKPQMTLDWNQTWATTVGADRSHHCAFPASHSEVAKKGAMRYGKLGYYLQVRKRVTNIFVNYTIAG